MTATKTRPMVAVLRSLENLNQSKDHADPAKTLAALIKIRGVRGSLVDMIDGLSLVAERDDVSQADHTALTAELDTLRDWACGLA